MQQNDICHCPHRRKTKNVYNDDSSSDYEDKAAKKRKLRSASKSDGVKKKKPDTNPSTDTKPKI